MRLFLNNRLDFILDDNFISRSELAKGVGSTLNTVNAICEHKYEPSVKLCILICTYINAHNYHADEMIYFVEDIFYIDKEGGK